MNEGLIPRSSNNECPKNTHYKEGFGTCSCEEHCGWDVCRLVKAPEECILDTFSEWQWDAMKNGWIAQVTLGSVIVMNKIQQNDHICMNLPLL